jgi:hypothetical protein
MNARKKSLWPKLPEWKRAVLSSDAWPANLVVPEQVRVTARAGVSLSGHDENLHWQWELRLCQPGDRYVLRVWPYGCPTAHLDDRKGGRLTVREAWEFALTNSMPHCLMDRVGLYHQKSRQRKRISHETR